jgi:hypothetical protein
MQASPAAILPSPDFTCTPPGCVFKAGVRPFRRGTYRLEIEPLATNMPQRTLIVERTGGAHYKFSCARIHGCPPPWHVQIECLSHLLPNSIF